MPKATKAQRARLDALDLAHLNLRHAVYSCAPRTDVKLEDCMAQAPAETVAAYIAAREAVDEYCREMISQGRAWRTASGCFYWN